MHTYIFWRVNKFLLFYVVKYESWKSPLSNICIYIYSYLIILNEIKFNLQKKEISDIIQTDVRIIIRRKFATFVEIKDGTWLHRCSNVW